MSTQQLSTEDLRAMFPQLAEHAYLATCSIAPASTGLSAALQQMITEVRRGRPWPRFEETCDGLRQQFAALIGAQVDQIALVPNVSTGVYQAASVQRWRGRRRKVLVAGGDWPGVAHVWLAQQVRGCEVVTVDTADGAHVLDNFLAALDERTAVVCAPLVTWRDGVRLPIADLARAAHDAGARVFVDASQAAGVLPVDVEALGCDYLVTATSKYLLGLPGTALLYVRHPSAGPKPTLTGRRARRAPHDFDPFTLDWPASARRLETGTPDIASVYAAVAGLRLIAQLDVAQVHADVTTLANAAAQRLTESGVRLLVASAEHRGAHLALHDRQPEALALWLQAHGVITAPHAGLVRASFHAFNTGSDVARLCEAVDGYRARQRLPERARP